MGICARIRAWWNDQGDVHRYECYRCHQLTEYVWTDPALPGQRFCSRDCIRRALPRERRERRNGMVATREPINRPSADRVRQLTIQQERADAIIDQWVIDPSSMLYWRCPNCEGLTLIEPERVQMTKIEPGGLEPRARTYLDASIIVDHQAIYAHMQQCPARGTDR